MAGAYRAAGSGSGMRPVSRPAKIGSPTNQPIGRFGEGRKRDAGLAARSVVAGTPYDARLLGRLDLGRLRSGTVRLYRADGHRRLGHFDRCGRHDRHRHRRDLVVRRLVCRRARRPLWPGAHAAIRDPVVFGLHLSLRLRAELRAAVHPARPARARLRRRVGHWCGIDGRGHSRQISRSRRRFCADRRGLWARARGTRLCGPLCCSARRDRVAGAVLGRHPARSFRAVDPPQRSRNQRRSGAGATPARNLGSPTCSRRFKGRICG